MDTTAQARDNREFVRRLLRERQPDFAVMLESVEQELCCPVCLAYQDEPGTAACF
jgi:hypothetical protein